MFKQNSKKEYIKIQYQDGIKLVPRKLNLKKIYLELSTECNFNCITCIRNSWNEQIGQMNDQVLESILTELHKFPELKTVQAGGFGEPQLHPRFMEVARRVKEMDLEFEFITNGHFLTPETVDELIALQVDKIIVSIDAPTEEDFENIRNKSNFTKIIDNLKYISKKKKKQNHNKPHICFEFVAMKDNYLQLNNLIKLAQKLNIDSILITNLLPYTEDMIDQTLYEQKESPFYQGSKGNFLYLNTHLPAMKLKTNRYCNFIESKSLSINWEGKIAPCYPLLHSYTCYIMGRKKEIISHFFGQIPQNSITEIWQKEDYIKFRHQVRHEEFPSCPDCDYQTGCGMVVDNQLDCWGKSPSCADCLWYREIIVCP